LTFGINFLYRSPTPAGSINGPEDHQPPPPIVDPLVELQNSWTTTMKEMAVEAKEGRLTSQALTFEFVAHNLQFMAMEKGPTKPGQKRKKPASAVSANCNCI